MSEENTQGPIQTLRDGAIVVKLWRQEGKNGPYVSATLGRTYRKERTGEYGESRSLSGADVLKAQALLGEANKEMILWREHFKEMQRQQQAERAETKGQVLSLDGRGAAPAAQEESPPAQGLTAQRDAALADAKPPTPACSKDWSPER